MENYEMDVKIKVESDEIVEPVGSQVSEASNDTLDVMNTGFVVGSQCSQALSSKASDADTQVIGPTQPPVETAVLTTGVVVESRSPQELTSKVSDAVTKVIETTEPPVENAVNMPLTENEGMAVDEAEQLTDTVNEANGTTDDLNTAALTFMKSIFTPSFANKLPKETRIKFGRVMAGPYWPRRRSVPQTVAASPVPQEEVVQRTSVHLASARKSDSLDCVLKCMMEKGKCGFMAMDYCEMSSHRVSQHLIVPEPTDYKIETGYLRSQKFYKCNKLDFNGETCTGANLSGNGLVNHMSLKVHAGEVEIVVPFCTLCEKMFCDRASYMKHCYEMHAST